METVYFLTSYKVWDKFLNTVLETVCSANIFCTKINFTISMKIDADWLKLNLEAKYRRKLSEKKKKFKMCIVYICTNASIS